MPCPLPFDYRGRNLAITGVIGGIWFLAILIAAYFGYRWWREKNAKKLRVQEDSLGEYEFDDQWRDQPQSPTKYDQDIPTGQALAPNRLFHMDVSVSFVFFFLPERGR